MAVVCFLDNDVLLKLAGFELLDEAIAALKISPDNLYVLESARFVFRDSPSVIAQYSQSVRDRAITFVKSCHGVLTDVESCDFIALSKLKNLDEGEAGLLTATNGVESFVLITGDKRCLKALANGVGIATIQQRLRGRVICLEQVILVLIQLLGFEVVKARVVPMRDCDKSLKACFGSGDLATETNVVEALEGYIATLRQDAPGLLADLEQF
jgi:hypothetical protein